MAASMQAGKQSIEYAILHAVIDAAAAQHHSFRLRN